MAAERSSSASSAAREIAISPPREQGDDAVRRHPEGWWAFCRVEGDDPATRSGAHIDPTSTFLPSVDEQIHRLGDARQSFADSLGDFAVLFVHEPDDLSCGHLIQPRAG